MPRPKRFEPTDDMRRMVASLIGYGLRVDDIRPLILNPNTGNPFAKSFFRRCFQYEIKTGVTRSTAKVAETLYQQAVGRPAMYDEEGNVVREELKPSVPACIFWMKARAGWSERATIEWTGPNGGPIQSQEVAAVRTYLPANNRDQAKQPAPRAISSKSG